MTMELNGNSEPQNEKLPNPDDFSYERQTRQFLNGIASLPRSEVLAGKGDFVQLAELYDLYKKAFGDLALTEHSITARLDTMAPNFPPEDMARSLSERPQQGNVYSRFLNCSNIELIKAAFLPYEPIPGYQEGFDELTQEVNRAEERFQFYDQFYPNTEGPDPLDIVETEEGKEDIPLDMGWHEV